MQQQDTNIVTTPLPFGLNRSLTLRNSIVSQRPVLSNTTTNANPTQRLPNSMKSVATRGQQVTPAASTRAQKTASIVVTPTIRPFSTQTSTYKVGESSRRTKRSKRPALQNRTPIKFNLDDDGNVRKVYDKYYGISEERLYFHRAKQSKLRCDTYLNIRISIAAGNTDLTVPGKPIVLSFSFTGGPRYMRQNYMDAIALCRCATLTLNGATRRDQSSICLSEQQVLYDKNFDLETVLHKPSVGHSMFEGWMKMNKLYPAAKELTYAEFPTKYVWNAPKRCWMLRKQKSIGRIHNVPVSTGDAFYCRMLLNSAKGCRTHDEIKKVNGVVYPTYKEACYATGLLKDDKERCAIQGRQILKRPDLVVSDEKKKNVALFYIEELMRSRGRTAHSRFHIPINIDETSTCSGALLKKCKLFIWDEVPMTNKLCFEALDRTLRDVLRKIKYDTCETPFGNMTMVFVGDFRQVLPVIPKGSRQDIVNASLKQSYLWDHCKVLKLTAN
nr:ATP-dependent DNA helicase PIF1-like [Tanacetum cinerariifolium]